MINKETAPLALVFDIETIPQPESKLLESMPPFDPADVKVGNIKDPALIQAKVDAAKDKHKADYLSKAALSPVTGEVAAFAIALVYQDDDTPWEHQLHSTPVYVRADLVQGHPAYYDGPRDERQLLEAFWDAWRTYFTRERTTWVGHNILDFDLPFLVNRSRILGINVPFGVMESFRGKVYFSSRFVDTRTHWLLGRKASDTPSSLDLISKAFGLPGKTGNGADFGKTLKENPKAAIEYLGQDIILTKTVALRMGLLA